MSNPHPSSRGRPFKPGQSGNPGGRTKAAVDLLAVLNSILGEKEKSLELMTALIDAGIGGDVRAIALVLDRVHGPVAPIGTTEGTLAEVAKTMRNKLESLKKDDVDSNGRTG